MSLFTLKNFTCAYNGKIALDIPELTIEEGTILGVCGANGSGKSTLLRALALLDSPTKGTLHYKGQPTTGNEFQIRKRITLLTQRPYLLKRTVLANIGYGLKVRGQKDNIEQAASMALKKVGLDPKSFLSRRHTELSGGEAQRVALAARLALKPQALLLDEPTSALDPESAEHILQAALRARDEDGCALIVVSHHADWLDSVADSIITLHHGRLAGQGRVNIIEGPWHSHTSGLCIKHLPDRQVIKAPESESCSAQSFFLQETAIVILGPTGKNINSAVENTMQYDSILRMNVISMTKTGTGFICLLQCEGLQLRVAILESHDSTTFIPAVGQIVEVGIALKNLHPEII
ncbi:MAG: ATP-binding cassette domain-containing protein [Desulfovibrio sp.]